MSCNKNLQLTVTTHFTASSTVRWEKLWRLSSFHLSKSKPSGIPDWESTVPVFPGNIEDFPELPFLDSDGLRLRKTPVFFKFTF